jgi:hypothetical protein
MSGARAPVSGAGIYPQILWISLWILAAVNSACSRKKAENIAVDHKLGAPKNASSNWFARSVPYAPVMRTCVMQDQEFIKK